MKQNYPKKKEVPPPPDTTISFVIRQDIFNDLENHIDEFRIAMRKLGKKFSKKQMYSFLIQSAIENFDADAFAVFIKEDEAITT